MIPLKPSRYWPHPPSAKQYAFLALPHLEALYGGAGGGGKTDALLMAALQYVDVPGYSALLLRRTYRQLTRPGQLLDLAKQWLRGTDAKWIDGESKYLFPSGASITFGHLDSERDLEDYSGPSYQFIGFDELTQFPEAHYTFLFTRLRRTESVQAPVRMRSASNPGGSGHRWVKARFIEAPRDPKRVFIPARVRDNPVLDVEQYEQSLAEVDPQLRLQILEGDWDAREPGEWFFDERDLAEVKALGHQYDRLLRDGALEPAGGAIQLGIDWGESTHMLPIWPLEAGGIYVPPREVVSSRGEPGEVTRSALAMLVGLGQPFDEARYDAAGVQSMRTFEAVTDNLAEPPGIFSVSFNKRKAETAKYLRYLIRNAGRGRTTRVLAVSPENTELLAQLGRLESDPEGESWRKDEEQHGADALIAGVAPVARRFREQMEVDEADARKALA